jgi:integrase
VEYLEEFLNYLRTQTSLSERSIKFYYWLVRKFLAEFREDSLENMNAFIKAYPLSKFAFMYYLRFKNRENEYVKLIKTKTRLVEKEGVFLSREKLLKIVESIQDDIYRMVALLQYLTGARAHEILKLKKEDFKIENEMLKIKLIGKGGYERVVFIPQNYKQIIWQFVSNYSREYPFLKGENKSLEKLVYNNYIYYYMELKKAAASLGYEKFATHDFRRNFVNDIFSQTQDIRIAKNLIGHARMETTLRYLKRKISEEEYRKYIQAIR